MTSTIAKKLKELEEKEAREREPVSGPGIASAYMRTQEEKAVAEQLASRKRAPIPELMIGPNGVLRVSHPDEDTGKLMLCHALGCADFAFVEGIVKQLTALCVVNGSVDVVKLNYLVAMTIGFEPKDQKEAVMASHMVLLHCVVFDLGPTLPNLEIDQMNFILPSTIKAARTFAAQLETLHKIRQKPEQKIVQNVVVGDGGQAIVGDVKQGRRIAKTKARRSRLALTHSNERPMEILAVQDKKPVAVKRKSTK
jgi:hypothetical protein